MATGFCVKSINEPAEGKSTQVGGGIPFEAYGGEKGAVWWLPPILCQTRYRVKENEG